MSNAEKTVTLGAVSLAFLDEGEGETIVFLHGFPLSKRMWSDQIQPFRSTHRVIAPDLRGHGNSTVSAGQVTMQQMAEDVLALLDALSVQGTVTLCGLSMGGYVAWEFWQLAAARLRRLILCDTRAAADSLEIARGRQMMAHEVVRSGAVMAADTMTPKLLSSHTQKVAPQKKETVREMILATHVEGIAATQRGMAARADFTDRVSSIDVPALILCGSEDSITPPAEMRTLSQSMARSCYVEIPHAGHLAPLEQPTLVNDAIQSFLANT